MLIASLLMLFVSGQIFADCADTFAPFGKPMLISSNADSQSDGGIKLVEICHTGQLIAFNPNHNVSDWVAFEITRTKLLNPKVDRKDRFHPDPNVPEGHQIVKNDYRNTGYDRGHLAPAAAMKWSKEAMDDSFFMSNIAPQVGRGFNRHIWKDLEQKMRQWSCERDRLYITTGPLYEDESIESIKYDRNDDGEDDNGILVDVPSHFFKFALDPNRMEAIAFILENRELKREDLPKYLTSIDEIERRTNLDFLSGIWDRSEEVIESYVQPELWAEPQDSECSDLK